MKPHPENLRFFNDEIRQLRESGQSPTFDGGGGGGYDGRMEERVKKLEEVAEKTADRLTSIERDVATMTSNYVTKADLAEAMNAQVKWMVGVAVGLGVAFLTIITFVLNNAVPKAAVAPTAPPVPIVIYAQPAPAEASTAQK